MTAGAADALHASSTELRERSDLDSDELTHNDPVLEEVTAFLRAAMCVAALTQAEGWAAWKLAQGDLSGKQAASRSAGISAIPASAAAGVVDGSSSREDKGDAESSGGDGSEVKDQGETRASGQEDSGRSV